MIDSRREIPVFDVDDIDMVDDVIIKKTLVTFNQTSHPFVVFIEILLHLICRRSTNGPYEPFR